MRRLALILVLGLAGLTGTRAQDTDDAVLLAAHPGLSGPYECAVVLAVPSGNGTHIGFILNRPTAKRAATMFPDLESTSMLAAPLFFGGPHLRGSVFALVHSPLPPTEDSVEVLPELYLAHGRDEVARVAERVPARARFFVGIVAWKRGQLQAELDAGAWFAAEPDLDIVLNGSADTLWQRLLERARTMLARH